MKSRQVVELVDESGYPNGYPRFARRCATVKTREFSNEISSPDGIRTHDLFLERAVRPGPPLFISMAAQMAAQMGPTVGSPARGTRMIRPTVNGQYSTHGNGGVANDTVGERGGAVVHR